MSHTHYIRLYPRRLESSLKAHMAKSVELPQDIIDNVIAAVGGDTHFLKQCSLVSSSFLRPSRKHLFSRIIIGSDQTSQGIHRLLIQNPVIQTFVRAITLMHMDGSLFSKWINGTSLLAILRLPFGCLESFSIVLREPDDDDGGGGAMVFILEDDWPSCDLWDWDSFSSEMKDALSNIIISSTLKTICFNGIINVPTTFFLHIAHLTTLELDSLSPNNFRDENSPTRAALKGVAPMTSQTVIDRCVWRFGKEHVNQPFDLIFLPFLSRLRFLEIYLGLTSGSADDFEILASLMGSLSICLTSPVEFNIRFRGCNNFNPNTFYENLRNACSRLRLDSVATHPTISQLRVDININGAFHCEHDDGPGVEPDKDKVLKAVLSGLSSLCVKGILFVKAVRGE